MRVSKWFVGLLMIFSVVFFIVACSNDSEDGQGNDDDGLQNLDVMPPVPNAPQGSLSARPSATNVAVNVGNVNAFFRAFVRELDGYRRNAPRSIDEWSQTYTESRIQHGDSSGRIVKKDEWRYLQTYDNKSGNLISRGIGTYTTEYLDYSNAGRLFFGGGYGAALIYRHDDTHDCCCDARREHKINGNLMFNGEFGGTLEFRDFYYKEENRVLNLIGGKVMLGSLDVTDKYLRYVLRGNRVIDGNPYPPELAGAWAMVSQWSERYLVFNADGTGERRGRDEWENRSFSWDADSNNLCIYLSNWGSSVNCRNYFVIDNILFLDSEQYIKHTGDLPMFYTVRFNAAGGSIDNNNITVKDGDTIELPHASRGGHKFNGWHDLNESFVGNAGDEYVVHGNTTLSASWSAIDTNLLDSFVGTWKADFAGWNGDGEEYLIFNANGTGRTHLYQGSWYQSSNFVWHLENDNLCIMYNNWGEIFCDNYSFSGNSLIWGGVEYIKHTGELPVIYTVVFNAVGGSVNYSTRTARDGDTIELPRASRSGYKFDGWYDLDGNFIGNASDLYVVRGNIALSAAWSVIETSQFVGTWKAIFWWGEEYLVFNTNGTGEEYRYEDDWYELINFTWYLEDDNLCIRFSVLGTNCRNYSISDNSLIWGGYEYIKHNGDLPVFYTVNFNTAGGNNISIVIVKGGNSIELPRANRSGYKFDGWYDSNGNFVGNTGDEYVIRGNITLSASWSVIDASHFVGTWKGDFGWVEQYLIFKADGTGESHYWYDEDDWYESNFTWYLEDNSLCIEYNDWEWIECYNYSFSGNTFIWGISEFIKYTGDLPQRSVRAISAKELSRFKERFLQKGEARHLVIVETKDRNGRTHTYSSRLGVKR